jgi:hypothetical protein
MWWKHPTIFSRGRCEVSIFFLDRNHTHFSYSWKKSFDNRLHDDANHVSMLGGEDDGVM